MCVCVCVCVCVHGFKEDAFNEIVILKCKRWFD